MNIIKRHHSPRGLPLAYHQPARERSVLSVELSEKWSDLFIIHPSGHVSRVSSHHLEAYAAHAEVDPEILWSGHTFNARHFDALADFLGVVPCEISRQIVAGRWILEGNMQKRILTNRTGRRDGGSRGMRAVWFTGARKEGRQLG